MENYILLDGKKFEMNDSLIELLRGVVKEEVEKEKEKSPFTRVSKGENFWYISIVGTPYLGTDFGNKVDDGCYNTANYCTDKKLMEQRALHETLNRLLWRFNEIHGGDSQWDGEHQHWYIMNREGEFAVDFTMTYHSQGVVYFSLSYNAIDAIEQVVKPFIKKHPDFVW